MGPATALSKAVVGMFTFSLEGRITRNPSVLKYQKSLSFLSGPPMSPPHWLAF